MSSIEIKYSRLSLRSKLERIPDSKKNRIIKVKRLDMKFKSELIENCVITFSMIISGTIFLDKSNASIDGPVIVKMPPLMFILDRGFSILEPFFGS